MKKILIVILFLGILIFINPETNDYDCSNIVPDKFGVSERIDSQGNPDDSYVRLTIGNDDVKWSDGVSFKSSPSVISCGLGGCNYEELNLNCRRGSKPGENINYYYCDNMPYKKQIEIVSDSGTIAENYLLELDIDLVLAPPENKYAEKCSKWKEEPTEEWTELPRADEVDIAERELSFMRNINGQLIKRSNCLRFSSFQVYSVVEYSCETNVDTLSDIDKLLASLPKYPLKGY